MHIIIIAVIAATIIFARIASRPRPSQSMPPVSPSQPTWHRRGSVRLLGRAVTGLVIALAIIGFSALPWPATAGVWSDAMAADITNFQVGIWQHRDLLLLGSVVWWMVLPFWLLVIRLGLREGRALMWIGYLVPFWCYHRGRLVVARAAVGYQLRLKVRQPLWGLVTRWSHHGWWSARFSIWLIRRTLGCHRGGV